MVKRAVFVEKSWFDNSGILGFFHYAVKVDEDWYEIERTDGHIEVSKGNNKGKGNSINGDLHGKPRRRGPKLFGRLGCAGSTHKTDREILDFNEHWIRKTPRYHAFEENCQKYALECVQYLVGGSFNLAIPLSALTKWDGGPGSHAVSKDGFNEAKATTGKHGEQFDITAFEVEGPAASAAANWNPGSGNAFIGAEASLFRGEFQLVVVGARLEPNINTGIGIKEGQLQVKALGFGISVWRGLGIHTPIGSLGIGKF